MKNIITILMITIFFIAQGQSVNFTPYTKNTIDGTKYGAVAYYGSSNVMLNPEYDEVGQFNGRYFTVRKGKFWGIVDTANKTIVPFQHEFLTNLSDNRLFVGKGEKLALADINNKLLSGYVYDNAWNFSNGIAKVKVGSKIGYIDKSGATVIPVKFVGGSDNCQFGRVIVYISNWSDLGAYKLTYINGQSVTFNTGYSSNNPIVMNSRGAVLYRGIEGEDIEFRENGYTYLTKDDATHCGNTIGQIIDAKGKAVFGYENCCNFKAYDDSCIIIYSNPKNKFGAISYTGIEMLKPNFKDISKFQYGSGNYARAYFDDGTFFYIDKKCKCAEFDGVKCPN